MKFIKIQNDDLYHFGILGMKWGHKRGSNKKFSKEEKQIIRKKKNELLSKIVDSEIKIEKIVNKDMSISHRKILESDDPKELDMYLSEKASRINNLLKNNPSLVPKDVTFKFDKDRFNGDDMSLDPEYTYKGKPILFYKSTENDRVFLDDQKEVNHSNVSESELYHYGIPGMRWGIRRTEAQIGRAHV